MRALPESDSLQRTVVAALGHDIATGRIAIGEVVIPDVIGERFGVSRTIVREAFRSLEARGMIVARHRSGTRVQDSSHWDLLDPDVIAWRSDGPAAAAQLEELLVLREAIEPMAANLAASRADDTQIHTIVGSAAAMAAAAQSGDAVAFTTADREFHDAIVRASGSAILSQLLDTVRATLESRYRGTMPVFTAATPSAVERHRRLADAVGAHDSAAAHDHALRLVQEARAEVEDLPTHLH